MSNDSILQKFESMKKAVLEAGGTENIENQHKLGKLTARERVAKLLDEGSFVELDKYAQRSNAVLGFEDKSAPGEGVITGYGTIASRPVYFFVQDYTVLDGSMSAAQAQKITKAIEMAAKMGMPFIGVLDSAGARIQEGAAALNAYAQIMRKLTDVSGVIPTISVVAGPAAGSAAYIAALTDFTLTVNKTGAIFAHGPLVHSALLGTNMDADAVGGAKIQNESTGVAQFLCENEDQCFATLKKLISYLPSNNLEEAPYEFSNDDINRSLEGLQEPCDMRTLITSVVDDSDFFEVQAYFATNMITGFAKLSGNTVGIVANIPGTQLDSKACRKAARFISILDAYDLPILTFIDNEGSVLDLKEEQSNLIGSMSKLIYAYSASGSPMISLITGKAIGDGYVAMGTKSNGADILYAFPGAQISCLDAEAGAVIMFDKEIAQADDAIAARQEMTEKYIDIFGNPFEAARQGLVDEVIEPAQTRQMLIYGLEMALNKRENKLPKKHGVMPL